MTPPLDIVGNVTITLSVASLFLLIIGLPLVRGLTNKENLKRHGYLTIAALFLQTLLVLVVMIPSFARNINSVLALSPENAADSWIHVGLGIFSEASGFVYVSLWLVYSRSRMRCAQAKRFMIPTFVAWIIAIVSGSLIHILQMF